MELGDLLTGIACTMKADAARVRVKGIADDSRAVKEGYLFIAHAGSRADGHAFIADAVSRGSRAVLCERDVPCGGKGVVKVFAKDTRRLLPEIAARFYGRPAERLNVIGVTGTNGKTTITYLAERILETAGRRAGVVGTISYRTGARTLESKNTTPGPVVLQEVLREMVDAGREYAVMEVSSHALDQGRTRPILFDTAALSNITREHLDYHGTFARYRKAKARIFASLKPGGTAVLNADDPLVLRLKGRIGNPVLTYGRSRRAAVRAEAVAVSLNGSSFTAVTGRGKIRIETGLLGEHNVSNILCAAAIAVAQEIPLAAVREGVRAMTAVPGRLEEVKGCPARRVFIDYAHTEDALYNVLSLLRRLVQNDIITVFGCGGDRDTFKRPRMGRVACSLSGKVVITSDNPRSELPGAIINDIVKGIKGRHHNFVIETDRATAIWKALRMARRGDIVLIAGKGHETGQVIGERVIPFDDREVARRCLS